MIEILFQKSYGLDKNFLKFLLGDIKEFGYMYIMNLDDSQFIAINDYLNSINKYKSIFNKQLNAKQILVQGLQNLVLRNTAQAYLIQIDENQKLPNSYISIIDIIKLIENGTLEIKGLKIFNTILSQYQYNAVLYKKAFLKWSLLNVSQIL